MVQAIRRRAEAARPLHPQDVDSLDCFPFPAVVCRPCSIHCLRNSSSAFPIQCSWRCAMGTSPACFAGKLSLINFLGHLCSDRSHCPPEVHPQTTFASAAHRFALQNPHLGIDVSSVKSTESLGHFGNMHQRACRRFHFGHAYARSQYAHHWHQPALLISNLRTAQSRRQSVSVAIPDCVLDVPAHRSRCKKAIERWRRLVSTI